MAGLGTQIGAVSGRDVGPEGKQSVLNYSWCRLEHDNKLKNMLEPSPSDLGVSGCCAHLLCEVVDRFASHEETAHLKLLCRIGLGLVDPAYFTDGKTFRPPDDRKAAGYMSFLGSKTFAETRVEG